MQNTAELVYNDIYVEQEMGKEIMIDGNISCYRRFIKPPTIRLLMQCLQICHRSLNCVSSSE